MDTNIQDGSVQEDKLSSCMVKHCKCCRFKGISVFHDCHDSNPNSCGTSLYYSHETSEENISLPQKTLRDEYAMAIMTGMMSNERLVGENKGRQMIHDAFILADQALIARANHTKE